MRQRAVQLFEAAVKAADPALALRPHLADLPMIAGRYVLVSIGKAACAMMEEAIANLPKDAAFGQWQMFSLSGRNPMHMTEKSEGLFWIKAPRA